MGGFDELRSSFLSGQERVKKGSRNGMEYSKRTESLQTRRFS